MVLDNNLMFFDGVNASGMVDKASNTVLNGNGGLSAQPLWLFVAVNGGDVAGKMDVDFQTSDDAAFANARSLGNYVVGADGVLAVKMPIGALKFLRLVCDSTFGKGAVTAGLALDVDISGVMQ